MENIFCKGMKFIVTTDEFITEDWHDCLAKWKGETLTVLELLEDNNACIVEENDEDWITCDVDWDATSEINKNL